LLALAAEHDCELIGGDTTQGPLNICITVFGEVPHGQALLRSGARAGDALYVSGTLGDARLALECFRGTQTLPGGGFALVRQAMERPQPRVTLGLALRGLASSAIDVSDGLLGDLGHILRRSGVGATVRVDAVPRSVLLESLPPAVQRDCTLSGGDDYELLFTAPAQRADAVRAAARDAGVAVTCIGVIEAAMGLRLLDRQGEMLPNTFISFDHFQ
jgi:thiamine-monophosphate kinase